MQNTNLANNQSEDPKMQKAKKITGFLIHLFWFTAVNILLYILDYTDNGRINWAYWVTFGWGIGIISNGLSVFLIEGVSEKITKAVYKNLK